MHKISHHSSFSRQSLVILCLLLAFSQIWLGAGPVYGSELPQANTPTDNTTVYLPNVLRNSTGQSVNVFVTDGNASKFEMATHNFEESTGIDIQYHEQEDAAEIMNQIHSGHVPDLALLPQPGLVRQLANEGYTIDLNTWFSATYLLGQYDQAWLDLATFNNELAGVWYQASIKSLVWYPKAKFEAAGYHVPLTWTEMFSLTQQIAADGVTPWCIGVYSGPASGWVGTDWVEDIMLRTTSTANYDAWIDGTLAFSSPEVKNAFEIMGQIWLTDTYVYSGTAAINDIHFGDAPLPMFDDPPGCYLHRQASFIPGFFPPGAELGVDVDYFYLPPIDPQYGNPALIAGDLYVVMADRPEVRLFAQYLTTGESVRYLIEQGGWLAPQKDVDLAWYPTDTERGYAEILQSATTVRFDASDLMPGPVGAGTFWQGIVEYVDGVDLDAILAMIDASWP